MQNYLINARLAANSIQWMFLLLTVKEDKQNYKSTKLTCAFFFTVNLWDLTHSAPISQNGQTHSNNWSAIWRFQRPALACSGRDLTRSFWGLDQITWSLIGAIRQG